MHWTAPAMQRRKHPPPRCSSRCAHPRPSLATRPALPSLLPKRDQAPPSLPAQAKNRRFRRLSALGPNRYKTAIERRFTAENAKDASTPGQTLMFCAVGERLSKLTASLCPERGDAQTSKLPGCTASAHHSVAGLGTWVRPNSFALVEWIINWSRVVEMHFKR